MNLFEVMAEPIRRRIVEVLASGAHTSGNISEVMMHEFGVGRSAVQHHLAYLRRVNWVKVQEDYTTRWYALEDDVIPSIQAEARRLKRLWDRRVGWLGGQDPLQPFRPLMSKKGRRGHGVDPDDPWLPGRRPVPER